MYFSLQKSLRNLSSLTGFTYTSTFCDRLLEAGNAYTFVWGYGVTALNDGGLITRQIHIDIIFIKTLVS